jgi:hypothetical protein
MAQRISRGRFTSGPEMPNDGTRARASAPRERFEPGRDPASASYAQPPAPLRRRQVGRWLRQMHGPAPRALCTGLLQEAKPRCLDAFANPVYRQVEPAGEFFERSSTAMSRIQSKTETCHIPLQSYAGGISYVGQCAVSIGRQRGHRLTALSQTPRRSRRIWFTHNAPNVRCRIVPQRCRAQQAGARGDMNELGHGIPSSRQDAAQYRQDRRLW